jgi:hypothetical protein
VCVPPTWPLERVDRVVGEAGLAALSSTTSLLPLLSLLCLALRAIDPSGLGCLGGSDAGLRLSRLLGNTTDRASLRLLLYGLPALWHQLPTSSQSDLSYPSHRCGAQRLRCLLLRGLVHQPRTRSSLTRYAKSAESSLLWLEAALCSALYSRVSLMNSYSFV